MATTRRLAVDLANVFNPDAEEEEILATLAWGDEVHVDEVVEGGIRVTLNEGRPGFIRGTERRLFGEDGDADHVLRVDFVDVQQGDGAVVETAEGHTLLIDGGQVQLFARYLARRFRGSSDGRPKEIDCILVTHGDADHFAGLTQIHASEENDNEANRLFIHPARVYHNGLVKRPTRLGGRKLKQEELLGETDELPDGTTVVTALVDDPRAVDEEERNQFFRPWCRALDAWERRGPIDLRRLDFRSDGAELFSFLDGDGGQRLRVEVLGPITVDAGGRPALKFLGEPTRRLGRNPGEPRFAGFSAGHTINGHSVILRLTYGNVRLLFAGDLNEEAEELLTTEHPDLLRAEVLKVPHHGSADYSADFLKAVAPVVSVVSSGDDSEKAEHIHPRATLVAALGRHSRAEVEEPVVLVTELAAFFQFEGKAATVPDGREIRAAFSRKAFGIIKVRTNGERLLVYTYSGASDMKEAYAFNVDADGNVEATRIRK